MNLIELYGNSDFLLGVFSGIVATGFCWLLAKITKSVKKIFLDTKFVNVYNKSKIRYVYENQSKQAIDEMYKYAKDSKIIYVYTSLGATFTSVDSKFRKLLDKSDCDIRFIILHPDTDTAKIRKKEYNIPDFTEQLNLSIRVFNEHSNVKYVLHNELLRTRLYIFDEVMYLGFMLDRIHNNNSQIFRIGKDSYLYKCFSKQFDDIWSKYYKAPKDERLIKKPRV